MQLSDAALQKHGLKADFEKVCPRFNSSSPMDEAPLDYSSLTVGKAFVVPTDKYDEEAAFAWNHNLTALDAQTKYDPVPKFSLTVKHDIARLAFSD